VNDVGWIRKLWPFLSRHKKSAFIAFGVAIVGTALNVVTPLITGWLIDNWVSAKDGLRDRCSCCSWASGSCSSCSPTYGASSAVAMRSTCSTISDSCCSKLQHLDFARTTSSPPASSSRASSDLQLVQMLLSFLPMLAGNVVMVVMSLAVMLWLSPCSRWSHS
jgi:ATP-binding cassette subfamily B protein